MLSHTVETYSLFYFFLLLWFFRKQILIWFFYCFTPSNTCSETEGELPQAQSPFRVIGLEFSINPVLCGYFLLGVKDPGMPMTGVIYSCLLKFSDVPTYKTLSCQLSKMWISIRMSNHLVSSLVRHTFSCVCILYKWLTVQHFTESSSSVFL